MTISGKTLGQIRAVVFLVSFLQLTGLVNNGWTKKHTQLPLREEAEIFSGGGTKRNRGPGANGGPAQEAHAVRAHQKRSDQRSSRRRAFRSEGPELDHHGGAGHDTQVLEVIAEVRMYWEVAIIYGPKAE